MAVESLKILLFFPGPVANTFLTHCLSFCLDPYGSDLTNSMSLLQVDWGTGSVSVQVALNL